MWVVSLFFFYYIKVAHESVMKYRDPRDLDVVTKMKFPFPRSWSIHVHFSQGMMTFLMILDWTLVVLSFLLVWVLYEPQWSIRLRKRTGYSWLQF